MEAGLLEIDLSAIAHNLKEIKRVVGEKIKVMGVVKADAYGHGLIPVSRTLVDNNIDFLAVSYVEEGIRLRKAGIDVPVIILLGVLEPDIEKVFTYKLTPIIYRDEMAFNLAQVAKGYNTILPIFIKVDTGMGRLGVFYKEALYFLKRVSALSSLKIEGITSHLAVAETDKEFTKKQLNRFKSIINAAQKEGIALPYNHIANSAALLQYEESFFQVVRPGLSLYGIYPTNSLKEKIKLRLTMTFKTKVIYLKWLPKNVGVSYGHSFITKQTTKIAVLPVGYDQGLFRCLSNRADVLIKGKRAPIIGTVCMHLTIVDVTAIDGVEIGEEVIILGSQGKEEISAQEIAQKASTITYEVLCRFGRSNHRLFKHLKN
jgi:alanine racemase